MRMKTLFVCLFVFTTLFVCSTLGKQVECVGALCGCRVIRASLTTPAHIELVGQTLHLDVWSDGSVAHLGLNDIMVCSDNDLDLLYQANIEYDVIIDDVYQAHVAQLLSNEKLKAAADWVESYHPLDEIVLFSQELAKTYPGLFTLVPAAGKTLEGRDIPLFLITNGKAPTKPRLLLLGGQHAREWISPATLLYITNKLLSQYGNDSVVTNLLDNYDIVVVPVLNGDGYTYTWASSSGRLWRKNRRPNSDGSYGVDLNRNWGFHWCESGASTNPRDDTYCGTGPFSEPETQTIQSISLAYGPFKGAIDFHSYGQLIMRPYGWSSTPPPNNAELERIGNGMRDAMRAATGVSYTNQAIWQLYLSAGSSADWWVGVANIPYSYGFEARDTGSYGFLLPADQIVPSGEENFAAVNYLAFQVTS